MRPSELETWVQVYRKGKKGSYGGEGNLSSLVFSVKRLGCCDLLLKPTGYWVKMVQPVRLIYLVKMMQPVRWSSRPVKMIQLVNIPSTEMQRKHVVIFPFRNHNRNMTGPRKKWLTCFSCAEIERKHIFIFPNYRIMLFRSVPALTLCYPKPNPNPKPNLKPGYKF